MARDEETNSKGIDAGHIRKQRREAHPPAFGAMRQIDDAHMQAFVMKLADGGLSTHTIKDILLVLKMMMAYGRKKGLTDWREWDIHMPKDDGRHELTVLTHAEQRTLMAHLRRHISFRSLGLYICLCTGMRIGEICALKWDDIDTRMRVIKNKAHDRAHIRIRGRQEAHQGGNRAAQDGQLAARNTHKQRTGAHHKALYKAGLPRQLRAVKRHEAHRAAHLPELLPENNEDARAAADEIPRPAPHIRHALHRKQLRLQDGKLNPRALEH